MDGLGLALGAVTVVGLAGVARRGRGSLSLPSNERLHWLLAPRGATTQIGEETGRTPRDGIARWKSPHGSVRYVRFVHGIPVAGLQVVARPGEARTANAFTAPGYRRRGYALALVDAARRDHPHLVHSTDLSEPGRATVQADERRRR